MYYADTWEGAAGVRLIAVSLYCNYYYYYYHSPD